MTQDGTIFRALLRQKHWQKYSTFCTEYDKAARTLDVSLTGSWPSRPQLQRWLSGTMKTLPYPDHRRVLEAMFPGWTADQLFEPAQDEVGNRPPPEPLRSPAGLGIPADSGGLLDLTAAYATRAEFLSARSLQNIFAGSKDVRISGLSLNAIAQHLSGNALIESLQGGTLYRCLFLDPGGEAIARREIEEGHQPGHLQRLTHLNIDVLLSIKSSAGAAGDHLEMGTVNETVRFNLIIADQTFCSFQPYLPQARGLESPTFVVDSVDGAGSLFLLFNQVFESLWNARKPI